MPTINLKSFTRATLEAIAAPAKGRIYVYGRKAAPWLGCTITQAGARTYHVRATVDGKTKRMSIPNGRVDRMSVEEAVSAGKRVLAKVHEGVDPVAEKRAHKAAQAVEAARTEAEAATLKDLLDRYFEQKATRLRPRTRDKYDCDLRTSFGDYMNRPLGEITDEVVIRINAERGRKAASAMRTLKAVFNFAAVEYRDAGLYQRNPVKVLSEKRLTHKPKRKTTYVRAEDLPAWWRAVNALPSVAADYYLFLLLTGVRADTEAGALTWERVNLRAGTFTLINEESGPAATKNREDIELPLPETLRERLERRAEKAGPVFPGIGDGQAERRRVTRQTGIRFSRHDLRRTFLTIGEGIDVSWLAVKRLANHKSQEHGVTEGYIVPNLDRLRRASRLIENEILRLAEANPRSSG